MFSKIAGREKMLFLEALLLHLWVGLQLKIIPFRWIPRLFSSPQFSVGSRQSMDLELIKIAVQRAGGVSPWRNRCLVSSLAARCMLNRRGIPSQISLGVIKMDNNGLQAHAWIKSGELEVVEMKRDFTSLYTF